MVEIEASHRVAKEAKAMQSELSFRDHQLTIAQSSHTTAVKELNAERSKRKRDRQRAEREREEATAKAAAAISTANAAAAAASAAEQAAVAEAATALEKNEKAAAAAARRSAGSSTAANAKDAARPPFSITLAEIILSELADEVMVLLKATGNGAWGAEAGGVGEDGVLDFGGGSESYGGGGDGGGGGGRDGSWLRSPLEVDMRRRGRSSSFSSSAALDATPPVGARDYGAGDGGAASGSRYSGCRGTDSAPRQQGRATAGRNGDFRGASPLSLAFTPVRASSGAAVPEAGMRRREWSSEHAARDDSCANRGWRQGGGGSGPPSAGASWCDSNWGAADISPRHFGGVGFEGGRRVDDGMYVEQGERINAIRSLSSNMFTCIVDLVEGMACAGDLLDVLAAFLEELPGETVRNSLYAGQAEGER